jgi:hypothetical protein
MKIQPGMIVTDMSGSLGGQYAQHGKNGFVMAQITKPRGSTRNGAGLARALQKTISSGWSQLTYLQRARYENKAPQWQDQFHKNMKRQPTGFELYKLIASRAIRMELAVTNNPTIPKPTPPLSAVSFVMEEGSNTVLLTQTDPTGNNEWIFIFMSRQFPTQHSGARESLSLIRIRRGTGGLNINLFSNYTDRFGALRAGTRVKYKVWAVRNTSMARGTVFEGTVVVSA